MSLELIGKNKFTCPLRATGKCNSKERHEDFERHFIEDHKDKILLKDNRTVSIEMDINTDKIDCNMIYIANKTYLVITRVGPQDVLIVIFGKTEDELKIYFKMDQNGTMYTTKVLLLKNLIMFNVWDSEKGCSFSKDMLKYLLPGNNIKIEIEHLNAREMSALFLENIDRINCPVCHLFMRPPIVLCESGHSICQPCRIQLTTCPTCRSNFQEARNFTLEGICEQLCYPCKYNDDGCGMSLFGAEIDEHEKNCVMKPVECCFVDCISLVPSIRVRDHIMEDHFTNVLQNHIYKVKMNEIGNESFPKFLACFGHMFKVLISNDIGENYRVVCQIVGYRNASKKFTHEIRLVNIVGQSEINTESVSDENSEGTRFPFGENYYAERDKHAFELIISEME